MGRYLLFLVLLCSILDKSFGETPAPQGSNGGKDMLDAILGSKNVKHIMSKDLLKGGTEKLKKLQTLEAEILDAKKMYTFDFSDTANNKTEADEVDQEFLDAFGFSFDCGILIASHQNGMLTFTPVSNKTNPDLKDMGMKKKDVEKIIEEHAAEAEKADSRSTPPKDFTDYSGIPMIKFQVQHIINIHRCTWTTAHHGQVNLCPTKPGEDGPGVHLVFEVSLFRSVAIDGETIDNKYVRINCNSESCGAGFRLGDEISVIDKDDTVLETSKWGKGVSGMWTTSAIAREYWVSVSADGSKAKLKDKKPEQVDTGHEMTIGSSQTVGVNGGVEGNTANAGVSAEKTEEKTLSFHLQDYTMETRHSRQKAKWVYGRSNGRKYAQDYIAEGYDTMSFKGGTGGGWEFDQFTTVNNELLSVNSQSYSGFTPQFDATFITNDGGSTRGTTKFSITSGVWATPFVFWETYSTGIAFSTYAYHGYNEQYGDEELEKTFRQEFTKKFTVNWDHPVFSGYKPVYIHPQGFNDRCITVNSQGGVSFEKVDTESVFQAFLYKRDYHLESVSKRGYCLDSTNLMQLQRCNAVLSQKWQWQEKFVDARGKKHFTDYLYPRVANNGDKRLGVDTSREELGLFTEQDANGNGNININVIMEWSGVEKEKLLAESTGNNKLTITNLNG